MLHSIWKSLKHSHLFRWRKWDFFGDFQTVWSCLEWDSFGNLKNVSACFKSSMNSSSPLTPLDYQGLAQHYSNLDESSMRPVWHDPNPDQTFSNALSGSLPFWQFLCPRCLRRLALDTSFEMSLAKQVQIWVGFWLWLRTLDFPPMTVGVPDYCPKKIDYWHNHYDADLIILTSFSVA